MHPFVELLRPIQWAKNFLLFAPLFFSGRVTGEATLNTVLAFVSFCLAASATYALNDVLDAPFDRSHPKKSARPVARGAISPLLAVGASIVLCLAALGIGAVIPDPFLLLLIVYASASLAYSLLLKHLVVLDILWLSILFCLRLLAGVAAADVEPSSWIILFTWLLALMLVIGKRYVELKDSRRAMAVTRPVLCRYSPTYLRALLGNAGGMSLICYLLWANGSVEQGRFHALAIFPSGLFVAFGIFRYQLLVFQNRFDEDPTGGVLADPPIVAAVLLFVGYLSGLLYL